MSGPVSLGGSSHPPSTDPLEVVVERARYAVMAVAKAHTLFSGAATSLGPEHRAIADEAFALLEDAVRHLRDLVARLQDGAADEIRAREGRA